MGREKEGGRHTVSKEALIVTWFLSISFGRMTQPTPGRKLPPELPRLFIPCVRTEQSTVELL